MNADDRRTLELAEALCVAVAKRHEPTVMVPWVSRDRDIQWAMDALRCHLTGAPLPPRGEEVTSVADAANPERYRPTLGSRCANGV